MLSHSMKIRYGHRNCEKVNKFIHIIRNSSETPDFNMFIHQILVYAFKIQGCKATSVKMNLPIEWELREMRQYPGRVYYHNKITHESRWIRPLPYPGLKSGWKRDDPPLVAVVFILIKHSESPTGPFKNGHNNLTRDQAKELIDNILQRILNGEKFEDVAAKEADNELERKAGNIVPSWISKGKFDKSFEDAAWNLGIGEMSRPVETPEGWNIILRYG